jgi:hypothetical protein
MVRRELLADGLIFREVYFWASLRIGLRLSENRMIFKYYFTSR